MPKCHREKDVLLVIDAQTSLLAHLHNPDQFVARCEFLIHVAMAMGVPVIATEQAPDRLGRSDPRISSALGDSPLIPKTQFSAACCPEVIARVQELGREAVVLVGVETHICVCATAIDLIDSGYRVTVCPDAVSSRTLEAHKLGMERIRDMGAAPAHTESVAYEWLGESTDPDFRRVLELVKRFPIA